MAKLNTMYDAAKGLAVGRGWTTQIGDGAERYRIPGVAGYVTNNLIACIKRNGISPAAPDALSAFMGTKDGKALYELGWRCISNKRHYDAMTWYEWCNKNWGTKWNSCDNCSDLKKRTIIFSTAWSCPIPIVIALAQNFRMWTLSGAMRTKTRGVTLAGLPTKTIIWTSQRLRIAPLKRMPCMSSAGMPTSACTRMKRACGTAMTVTLAPIRADGIHRFRKLLLQIPLEAGIIRS